MGNAALSVATVRLTLREPFVAAGSAPATRRMSPSAMAWNLSTT